MSKPSALLAGRVALAGTGTGPWNIHCAAFQVLRALPFLGIIIISPVSFNVCGREEYSNPKSEALESRLDAGWSQTQAKAWIPGYDGNRIAIGTYIE